MTVEHSAATSGTIAPDDARAEATPDPSAPSDAVGAGVLAPPDGTSARRARRRRESRRRGSRRREGRAPRWAGDLALRLGVLAAALLTWWFVAAQGWWSEVIVPSPRAVVDRFVDSVTVHDGVRGLSGHFLWEHVGASAWRLARGVGWALVVGVPLGLVLGTVRPVRVVLEPVVGFVRALPPLAYFLLLIIWFGIEDTSKVWLLLLAAVAPITLAVLAGVDGVRREWVEAARALGAGRRQVLTTALLPAVLPELFTGTRLALGFAFSTIVAAETVDGIPGIGGLAWSTKKFLQTDVAVLCVLVIGLLAVAVDALLRRLEAALVPWRGRV